MSLCLCQHIPQHQRQRRLSRSVTCKDTQNRATNSHFVTQFDTVRLASSTQTTENKSTIRRLQRQARNVCPREARTMPTESPLFLGTTSSQPRLTLPVPRAREFARFRELAWRTGPLPRSLPSWRSLWRARRALGPAGLALFAELPESVPRPGRHGPVAKQGGQAQDSNTEDRLATAPDQVKDHCETGDWRGNPARSSHLPPH